MFFSGRDAVIHVDIRSDRVGVTGYLNIFIDWYQDRNYKNNTDIKHVAVNYPVSGGELYSIAVSVPNDAISGTSWSRFRVIYEPLLQFADPWTGRVMGGEVEDHLVFISLILDPIDFCPYNTWLAGNDGDLVEIELQTGRVENTVYFQSESTLNAMGWDDESNNIRGSIGDDGNIFQIGLSNDSLQLQEYPTVRSDTS